MAKTKNIRTLRKQVRRVINELIDVSKSVTILDDREIVLFSADKFDSLIDKLEGL